MILKCSRSFGIYIYIMFSMESMLMYFHFDYIYIFIIKEIIIIIKYTSKIEIHNLENNNMNQQKECNYKIEMFL